MAPKTQEFPGNPDYIPRTECKIIHADMNRRFDGLEEGQKLTQKSIGEVDRILNNGLGDKLKEHIESHNKLKWLLVGILLATIADIVYRFIA